MREEAARRVELMTDAERCEVVPVAVPEDMVVNEALELVDGLRALDLQVRRLVINMVQPALVGEGVEGLVDEAASASELPSWLLPAAAEVGGQRMQQKSIARLEEGIDAEAVRLPLIPGGNLDEASLMDIARAFDAEL
jgi:anion-transporting  ArsA/GET3 family ATPase